MQLKEAPALDTLLYTPPQSAADFSLGASVVRASILSRPIDACILPERGALPVHWAADGTPVLEAPAHSPTTLLLRPPIGTHVRGSNNAMHGINYEQKQRLVVNELVAYGLDNDGDVTLIDEVAMGGTISRITQILAKYVKRSPSRLRIIAAHDTRHQQPPPGQRSKPISWSRLAANRCSAVHSTTVIPLPLIAMDKDPLLNKLVRTDSLDIDSPDIALRVEPNMPAEQLFRALGTAARLPYEQQAISQLYSTFEQQLTPDTQYPVDPERWIEAYLRAVMTKKAERV